MWFGNCLFEVLFVICSFWFGNCLFEVLFVICSLWFGNCLFEVLFVICKLRFVDFHSGSSFSVLVNIPLLRSPPYQIFVSL